MDTASLTPQVKITCLIFVQFDCEDDYRTGCPIVSNCEQRESCSGLRLPRRWGSPIGFFNPVIPTQNFVQSRNSEGYFWYSTSQAYFQSRNSPRFCFKMSHPELQIREIPDPELQIREAPDPEKTSGGLWRRHTQPTYEMTPGFKLFTAFSG